MLRSKNIKDYFEVPLREIVADRVLSFDIHIFFHLNSHILVWRKTGDAPNKDTLDKYLARGLQSVWVHQSDRPAFELYQKGNQAELKTEVPANASASSSVEPQPEAKGPQTERGAFMAQVMNHPALNPEQKKAALSEAAQTLLNETAQADTLAKQAEADRKAWATIQDVLDAIAEKTEASVEDIWKMAKINPELEHAVHVATYTVIFAMAFGRIDQSLIADLATAGLLHDLGVSQLPPNIASRPWKGLSKEDMHVYAEHVNESIEILQLYSPNVSTRVKTMISQHHEKFDGTGYPNQLSGFKVDDVSQLLGMADLLDAMKMGHWDGKNRTLKESFEVLEGLEKARTFPEFFNPDVYSAVIKWVRNSASNDLSQSAAQVVGSQARDIIEKTG